MAVKFSLFWWNDAEQRMDHAFHDYGPIIAHSLPRVGDRIQLQGDRFYEVAAIEHHVYKLDLKWSLPLTDERSCAAGQKKMEYVAREFGYTPFPGAVPENWPNWATVDVVRVAVKPINEFSAP